MTDISAVLGTSYQDIGSLIRRSPINKWSKHKPVCNTNNGVLSESDFAGTAAEHSAGIWYAVHIAGRANDWRGIHDIDFAYYKPGGLLDYEPFRMLDFNGYAHNVAATINGYINGTEGYIDTHIAFDVVVGQTENSDSVPILECIAASAGNVYPCILLSDGSTYKAAALLATGDIATPLYYQGHKVENYHQYFDNAGLTEGSWVISLFMIQKQTGSNAFPLDGAWYNVPYTSTWPQQPFAVPNATNYGITLRAYDDTPQPTITGHSIIRVNTPQVEYTINPAIPTSTYYVRLHAQAYRNGSLAGDGYSDVFTGRTDRTVYLAPSINIYNILNSQPLTATEYQVKLTLEAGKMNASDQFEPKKYDASYPQFTMTVTP